ncbi:conserved oligomeric Golgi complex subunit 1, partial [Lecanoromycetidae sp. Uapishka_2]
MAAEPPDPKTFGSWEEAFQYPIPAVRGMERELRRDIDSNREKLRTLVGASYRDLLGTAESIIEMDGQMHKVEAYMGETGQRCNTRLLEKKGTNLRSWTDVAEAPSIEEVIKRLREAQWASEVDDVDDEDDLLDNKQALLSQDDPGLLQEELNTALHEAYTDLQMKLYKASPNQTDPNRGQKSTFLDRVWREIRQNLPKSYQYRNLGLNSIPMLHRNMADEVLRIPLERCSKRLAETSKASGLPTRPLWEGDPELPVLPSAWAYRLLLDTVSFMTMCGSDVWSACAVDELKQQLILHIIPLLRKDVKADAEQVNGHTNGDVGAHAQQQVDGVDDGDERSRDHEQVQPDGEDPEMPREKHVNGLLPNGNHGLTPREGAADVKIQKYFDISYIINATAVKNVDSKENGLVRLQETLMKEADLEPRSAQRMKKDAGEYWKRTNLLFALLI